MLRNREYLKKQKLKKKINWYEIMGDEIHKQFNSKLTGILYGCTDLGTDKSHKRAKNASSEGAKEVASENHGCLSRNTRCCD